MSMLSDGQFERMHRDLMNPDEGGFSVNAATGKKPQVGYMVSIPGYEKQIRSENVTPAHIKEFVEKHGSELAKDPDYHVGGWHNQKTGMVSLDISRRIKPDTRTVRRYGREVAEADARSKVSDLAVAYNQEAGWDVKRGAEIPNPEFDESRRNPPSVD